MPAAPAIPVVVLAAMTRRDHAAYREQANLAIALRREARGVDGAEFRALAESSRLEKEEAQTEVVRLFAEWLTRPEPAHQL